MFIVHVPFYRCYCHLYSGIVYWIYSLSHSQRLCDTKIWHNQRQDKVHITPHVCITYIPFSLFLFTSFR